MTPRKSRILLTLLGLAAALPLRAGDAQPVVVVEHWLDDLQKRLRQ